jgi:putative YhbY family RNA-binding protein
MPSPLTARERSHLKARAHALEPVVHIGHGGLTDAVVHEVDRALTAHELIKVRIGGDDRETRATLSDELCERTGASPVQRVGKVLVLWRERPSESGEG